MKMQLSRDVDVLIIEDDHYYNNLLAKRIDRLNSDPVINDRYHLNIKQVYDPEEYINRLEKRNNRGGQAIAFVDYYLGNGKNGIQVSERLVGLNDKIKIVILSQSEKTIKKLESANTRSKLYTKLGKHEYTPEICCIIVENYIDNL